MLFDRFRVDRHRRTRLIVDANRHRLPDKAIIFASEVFAHIRLMEDNNRRRIKFAHISGRSRGHTKALERNRVQIARSVRTQLK